MTKHLKTLIFLGGILLNCGGVYGKDEIDLNEEPLHTIIATFVIGNNDVGNEVRIFNGYDKKKKRRCDFRTDISKILIEQIDENDKVISKDKLIPCSEKIDGVYKFPKKGKYKLYYKMKKTMENLAYLFFECKNLTSVDFSLFFSIKTLDMSHMFSGCSSLISLDLKFLHFSEVTDMSHMFSGCSSLTSLDLSNWKIGKVRDMSYMFSGCSSLTSLDLSNWKTGKVRDMSYMFSGCSSLTSLDLSNWKTGNVVNFCGMFLGCENLIGLNIENFNFRNATVMSSMFQKCKKLAVLTGPTVEKLPIEECIYNNMFLNCDIAPGKLDVKDRNYLVNAFLSIEKTTWKNIGSFLITGRFPVLKSICPWLLPGGFISATFVFKGSPEEQKTDETTLIFFDQEDSCLKKIVYWEERKEICIISQNEKNSEEGKGFFNRCPLPKGETFKIFYCFNKKKTKTRYMFAECISMIDCDLSNFNSENVSDMKCMFAGCTSLKNVNFGNFNTKKVTDMSYMFCDCSVLTSLNLSNFRTVNVTDFSGMFLNCKKLENINIENFNFENACNMNYIFKNCESLNVCSSPIKIIPPTKRCVCRDMFLNCKLFENNPIPRNIDDFLKIWRAIKLVGTKNFQQSGNNNFQQEMFVKTKNFQQSRMNNFQQSGINNLVVVKPEEEEKKKDDIDPKILESMKNDFLEGRDWENSAWLTKKRNRNFCSSSIDSDE